MPPILVFGPALAVLSALLFLVGRHAWRARRGSSDFDRTEHTARHRNFARALFIFAIATTFGLPLFVEPLLAPHHIRAAAPLLRIHVVSIFLFDCLLASAYLLFTGQPPRHRRIHHVLGWAALSLGALIMLTGIALYRLMFS